MALPLQHSHFFSPNDSIASKYDYCQSNIKLKKHMLQLFQ